LPSVACDAFPDAADGPSFADVEVDVAQNSATASDPALCCGRRTTLVEGIKAAENLLISSDERLFASGDEGIFEIIESDSATFEAVLLESASDCQFGGMTEADGVLYANCYNFSDSFLHAAELREVPAFRRIATFDGVPLANGLTSDLQGNVYVATTFQSQIRRLRFAPDDRFRVVENKVWLTPSGLLTNGLKFFDGSIYWSDGTFLNRAAIAASGRPGRTRTLATRLTVFDDLSVDARGILVADYLGNAIRLFDLQGRSLGVSETALVSPSAVLRAEGRAGFSANALIVAEKGANRVSLITAQ
jgi:hypothetical protein